MPVWEYWDAAARSLSPRVRLLGLALVDCALRRVHTAYSVDVGGRKHLRLGGYAGRRLALVRQPFHPDKALSGYVMRWN